MNLSSVARFELSTDTDTALFSSFQDSVYLMDRGQNINKRPNIVYISTNKADSWVTLHDFVNVSAKRF